MLLCAIPRPSKHASPPLNTHTAHYTIPLAGYPSLAQALTLLQSFKDTHRDALSIDGRLREIQCTDLIIILCITSPVVPLQDFC